MSQAQTQTAQQPIMVDAPAAPLVSPPRRRTVPRVHAIAGRTAATTTDAAHTDEGASHAHPSAPSRRSAAASSLSLASIAAVAAAVQASTAASAMIGSQAWPHSSGALGQAAPAHSSAVAASIVAASTSTLPASPTPAAPAAVAAPSPRRVGGLRIHPIGAASAAAAVASAAALAQQSPLPAAAPPVSSPSPSGPSTRRSPQRQSATGSAVSLPRPASPAPPASASPASSRSTVVSPPRALSPVPAAPRSRLPPSKLQQPRALGLSAALLQQPPAPLEPLSVDVAPADAAPVAPLRRRSSGGGGTTTRRESSPAPAPSRAPVARSPSPVPAASSSRPRGRGTSPLRAPTTASQPSSSTQSSAASRRTSSPSPIRGSGRAASPSPVPGRLGSPPPRAASPAPQPPPSPRATLVLQRAASPMRSGGSSVSSSPSLRSPSPQRAASPQRAPSPQRTGRRPHVVTAPLQMLDAPSMSPPVASGRSSGAAAAALAAAAAAVRRIHLAVAVVSAPVDQGDSFDAVEVEVDEEVEVEVEACSSSSDDDSSDGEEDGDDGDESENSVPNRRPVHVMDALYEDLEHEPEESASELERRERRREARAAAGELETPPQRHTAPRLQMSTAPAVPSSLPLAAGPSSTDRAPLVVSLLSATEMSLASSNMYAHLSATGSASSSGAATTGAIRPASSVAVGVGVASSIAPHPICTDRMLDLTSGNDGTMVAAFAAACRLDDDAEPSPTPPPPSSSTASAAPATPKRIRLVPFARSTPTAAESEPHLPPAPDDGAAKDRAEEEGDGRNAPAATTTAISENRIRLVPFNRSAAAPAPSLTPGRPLPVPSPVASALGVESADGSTAAPVVDSAVLSPSLPSSSPPASASASAPVSVPASSSVPSPVSPCPPLLWSVPTPFDASFLSRHYSPSLHDLYFAYGSNMNAARMRARLVHFAGGRGVAARLDGYRLAFNKSAESLGAQAALAGAIGYANLLASAAPGAAAYGALYVVPQCRSAAEPGGLRRLDEFEGVALGMYARTRVHVTLQDGARIAAVTYLAEPAACAPSADLLRPTPSYLAHLLAGEPLLPAAVVRQLRATPTTWMADPAAGVAQEAALRVSEPTTKEMILAAREARKEAEAVEAETVEAAAATDTLTADTPVGPPETTGMASSAAAPLHSPSITAVPSSSSPPPGAGSAVASLRAKLAGFNPSLRLSGHRPLRSTTAGSQTDSIPAPLTHSAVPLEHVTLNRSSKRPARRPTATHAKFTPLGTPLLLLLPLQQDARAHRSTGASESASTEAALVGSRSTLLLQWQDPGTPQQQSARTPSPVSSVPLAARASDAEPERSSSHSLFVRWDEPAAPVTPVAIVGRNLSGALHAALDAHDAAAPSLATPSPSSSASLDLLLYSNVLAAPWDQCNDEDTPAQADAASGTDSTAWSDHSDEDSESDECEWTTAGGESDGSDEEMWEQRSVPLLSAGGDAGAAFELPAALAAALRTLPPPLAAAAAVTVASSALAPRGGAIATPVSPLPDPAPTSAPAPAPALSSPASPRVVTVRGRVTRDKEALQRRIRSLQQQLHAQQTQQLSGQAEKAAATSQDPLLPASPPLASPPAAAAARA